jgi:hypothetical protein
MPTRLTKTRKQYVSATTTRIISITYRPANTINIAH